MSNQLTSNAEALRLFFTEDVYLVKNELQNAFVEPVKVNAGSVQPEVVVMPKVQAVSAEQLPALPNLVAEHTEPLQKKLNFQFLGKNQQGILILVNDNANKVSTVQGTELLRKLVKAIELTNNDFALVNYADYEGTSYQDLATFFACKLLLSFGVEAKTLGLSELPLHQLVKSGDKTMVFTSNLHDLDSDQASKKILWGSLQKLK
ncbi:MAG: hypothetical protein EOP00_03280 [Pedobacter sp.]|nr:MAG: hypothetical protein EOP00_03280 [Pedobacter sp.]